MMYVYYLFSMYLISIFLVLLNVGSLVFAEPMINLVSPTTNMYSNEDSVLFKGKVTDVDLLTLNGCPVEIYENRFYVKALLQPFKTNRFILKAYGADKQQVVIKKYVDYFPAVEEPRNPYLVIESIKFNPFKNQWQIKGKTQGLSLLYIDEKNVRLLADKRFEYHVGLDQLSADQNFLTISALSDDLFLFSQEVSLYDTQQMHNAEFVERVFFDDYKVVQSAILSSYLAKNWQHIPFNETQQKMIMYLVENQTSVLGVADIKYLIKDNHIVLTVPFLSQGLDIQDISSQLMLIMRNTIGDLKHISVLWFNKVPGTVEVVFNKGGNTYWLLNDEVYAAQVAVKSKLLYNFKSNSFFEK